MSNILFAPFHPWMCILIMMTIYKDLQSEYRFNSFVDSWGKSIDQSRLESRGAASNEQAEPMFSSFCNFVSCYAFTACWHIYIYYTYTCAWISAFSSYVFLIVFGIYTQELKKLHSIPLLVARMLGTCVEMGRRVEAQLRRKRWERRKGTERRTVHKHWPVNKLTRHVRYSYQCSGFCGSLVSFQCLRQRLGRFKPILPIVVSGSAPHQHTWTLARSQETTSYAFCKCMKKIKHVKVENEILSNSLWPLL